MIWWCESVKVSFFALCNWLVKFAILFPIHAIPFAILCPARADSSEAKWYLHCHCSFSFPEMDEIGLDWNNKCHQLGTMMRMTISFVIMMDDDDHLHSFYLLCIFVIFFYLESIYCFEIEIKREYENENNLNWR